MSFAHPNGCECQLCHENYMAAAFSPLRVMPIEEQLMGPVVIRAVPGLDPSTAYLVTGRAPDQIVKIVNLTAEQGDPVELTLDQE